VTWSYLELRVVCSAHIQVSARSGSDEVEFDSRSVVTSVEWMDESSEHCDVVCIDSVLSLKHRNEPKVHVRRPNYVHLQVREQQEFHTHTLLMSTTRELVLPSGDTANVHYKRTRAAIW